VWALCQIRQDASSDAPFYALDGVFSSCLLVQLNFIPMQCGRRCWLHAARLVRVRVRVWFWFWFWFWSGFGFGFGLVLVLGFPSFRFFRKNFRKNNDQKCMESV